MDYIKHTIKCKCILPQFKNKDVSIFHQFVVFSELNDENDLISSIAQCNNCDVLHKVIEVGVSEFLLGKEESKSLPTIEEIKTNIPEKLVKILETYKCELTTWQEVQFILEKELWGKVVILTKEKIDSTTTGKYVLIAGKDLYKINNFSRED